MYFAHINVAAFRSLAVAASIQAFATSFKSSARIVCSKSFLCFDFLQRILEIAPVEKERHDAYGPTPLYQQTNVNLSRAFQPGHLVLL